MNLKKSKKNQLRKEMKYSTGVDLEMNNGKGESVLAIPVPSFVLDVTKVSLLLNTANFIADYMEQEGIKTVKQWDEMADKEEFKTRTFNYTMAFYHQYCDYTKVDMIESAPKLLQSVEELMNHKRLWCDTIVTSRTHFKYEWLPILLTIACMINTNSRMWVQNNIGKLSRQKAS